MVFLGLALDPSINLWSSNICIMSFGLNLICGKSTLTRPARGSSGFSLCGVSTSSHSGLGTLSSGGIYCFTTLFILPPANPL